MAFFGPIVWLGSIVSISTGVWLCLGVGQSLIAAGSLCLLSLAFDLILEHTRK